MTMLRRMLLSICLFALLAGLGGTLAAQAQAPAPRWLLRVGLGTTATLPGTPLTVTFDRVSEDSRCPADVACAWSGQVTVELTLADGSQPSQAVALTAFTDSHGRVSGHPDGPQQLPGVAYGPYRLDLRRVNPYPLQHDQPLAEDAYVVTLEVSQAVRRSQGTTAPPRRATPTPVPTPVPTPLAQAECADSTTLPVLCVNYRLLVEKTAGVATEEPAQLGAATAACRLTSQAEGDAVCAALGEGWQMADAAMLAPGAAWSEFLVVEEPAWSWDWETGGPVSR